MHVHTTTGKVKDTVHSTPRVLIGFVTVTTQRCDYKNDDGRDRKCDFVRVRAAPADDANVTIRINAIISFVLLWRARGLYRQHVVPAVTDR